MNQKANIDELCATMTGRRKKKRARSHNGPEREADFAWNSIGTARCENFETKVSKRKRQQDQRLPSGEDM